MSKLTEIDKRIKRDTKTLEEVENDSSYTDEQRQFQRDRLGDLNTEKQARLELLSQNRKDLQIQAARIKQTLENVRDKNMSYPERIPFLIREQIVTIILTLSGLLTGITTIVLSAIGAFGEAVGQEVFYQKIRGP